MPGAEPAQPRILAVDDDALVLGALESLFALETEYAVSVHSDPKDAITELERNSVDLIISDFLMPKMNGIEFPHRSASTATRCRPNLTHRFRRQAERHSAINEAGSIISRKALGQRSLALLLIRNALEERSLRRLLNSKIQVREADAATYGPLRPPPLSGARA